jgi:hypothetical protein
MTDQQIYLHNKVRMGWALLILGIVVFATGLVLQFLIVVAFNARIISGLGILFIGLGLAQLVRYRSVQGDRRAAARLVNEERDERIRLIRARAGNRAFWVSLVMTYIALMWLSFASSGSLPSPTPDGLWWYLAAAVVVPFVVYISSIVYDEQYG